MSRSEPDPPRKPPADDGSPRARPGPGERPLWWKRMLTKVRRHPAAVLRDRRCRKPEFCQDFFDLCDDVALQEPKASPKYAAYAVELAHEIGDPHLILRAQGVVVHAHIANRQWREAQGVLDDTRPAAFSCCEACRGDWLKRHADLQLETRDGDGALEKLAQARREMGPDVDDDTLGRHHFLTGISHHVNEDPDRAVRDAGRTLMELDLDSPRGYFLDTLAFCACFLQLHGERHHYEQTLEHLGRFMGRIKGLKGWTDVRVRRSWVEGLVRGRLGHRRSALDLLDIARLALFKTGPVHHATAVTFDEGHLYAQCPNDASLRVLKTILGRCERRKDLAPRLRKLVRFVKRKASSRPEKALDALVAARLSFIVPVPPLLSEVWRPLEFPLLSP